MRPDSGPCNDRVYKFFYSEAEDVCKMFIFGGCRVNDNVFNGFESCMETCSGNGTNGE